MQPLLYAGDLVPWYRLVDPPADHAAEAGCYRAALERALPAGTTLLELGAGAGHNALHMKQGWRCTLTDISEDMLALSFELNPECSHVLGDMRTLRLGRTFDYVFVHDAIAYMTTEDELRAALHTAYIHTRSGGVALFAPDHVRESFEEHTSLFEEHDETRALRCVEWKWDPDPSDTKYAVEYAFLLREDGNVRAVHDRHIEGLFPKATWIALLKEVGYEVEPIARPLDDEGAFDEVFLCRKP